jgi:hypothetical protein
MVRTQVQLTEAQAAKLKELAIRQDVSIAELIRRGVDQLLSTTHRVYDPEQKRLALAFVGQFPDEATDVAENHDLYLAEIYAQVAEPEHS